LTSRKPLLKMPLIQVLHDVLLVDLYSQVATYWGMAASFVLDGTLKEKTFFDPARSQELFTVFSKVRPFLKELR
jgi:hypothetical protein